MRCSKAKRNLLNEFERRLRVHVDDRIAGKVETKTDFAKLETDKLTLIDTHAMDESVVTGNIIRVVENLCHDELQLLNRGVGHLLGQPELETDRNPFAPAAIVEAFAESLQVIKAEAGAKFTILKELNRASLSEINGIYADLNKHLQKLHVMPAGSGRAMPIRRTGGRRAKAADRADEERTGAPGPSAPSAGEIDVMELFRRRFGGDASPQAPGMRAPHPGGTGAPGMGGGGGGVEAEAEAEAAGAAAWVPTAASSPRFP